MSALPPILAAVAAADPYPFYAELRRRSFFFDEALGAWVAADAAAVEAVLADPRLRVRPAAEPVPAAIAGSAAGEIFRQLARMDDSPGQVAVKAALGAALAGAAGAAPAIADRWARRLLEAGASYDELAFWLPAATLGELLGLPEGDPAALAARIGALARCFAPGCRPEDAAAGIAAAEPLCELCGLAVDGKEKASASPLLAELCRRLPGRREAILANTIGLFTQAHEATAGLLAGSLLAAMRNPAVRLALSAGPAAAAAAVAEVALLDPPVQNTRRFAAAPLQLLGQQLEPGDTILVLLAAASRDPRASGPAGSSWGHGRHACPGSALAVSIAAAGAAALAAADAIPAEAPPFSYRPSLNTRVPLFGAARPGRTS